MRPCIMLSPHGPLLRARRTLYVRAQSSPDFAGGLSVIVPVKNEAENVLPLIEEIHASLEGKTDFELIYVDDGSDDATPALLARAAKRFPRLHVIRHRQACGQSTAVATGVQAARYPWIATLDGDCQNDPADLPKLLAVLSPGQRTPDLDLVIGWRTTRNDSPVRKLSSRIANGVRGGLLDRKSVV